MLLFEELPVDIVPVVISHLIRPQHLASASRVCKLFHEAAVPSLYFEVSIYPWHRDPKAKALNLVRTLGTSPHLAKRVRRIVIRDFPKIGFTDDGIREAAISAIRNLCNLYSCIWTRDGTMKSQMLDAVKDYCPKLRELEINGRHKWNYGPDQLLLFSRLEKITLLMPSSDVTNELVKWCRSNGENLRELTLICKSTSVVTDEILSSIAPYVSSLKTLRIGGCPKVSHIGVLEILYSCAPNGGIEDLRLESVSTTMNLDSLASVAHSTFTSLKSLTLTLTKSTAPSALTAIQDLLGPSCLRNLNIYLTGNTDVSTTTNPRSAASQGVIDQGQGRSNDLSAHLSHIHHRYQPWYYNIPLSSFLCNVISKHSKTLTRVAILRLPISLSEIRLICESCKPLRELFVVVDVDDLPEFARTTSRAPNLQSIHVNILQNQWGDLIARGLPNTSTATQTLNDNDLNGPESENNIDNPTPTPAETDEVTATSTTRPEQEDDHDYLDSDDESGFMAMLHTTNTSSSPSTSTPSNLTPQTTLRYTTRMESLLESLGVPSQLGPRVSQFGLTSRVWGVEFASDILPSGEVLVTRRLVPYESQRVPDAFLVMT